MIEDDDRLRAESSEIEHLLGEIEDLVTPPAWQRVERVMSRVIRLYGAALAHTLDHARSSGADETVLDERVADDELLASLLVLHGLHPMNTEQRVLRALAAIREQLGLAEEALELVGFQDGALKLRANETLGGAMASRVAEGAIRRVIEAAAPELRTIEIDGQATPRPAGLVQIRTRREVP